MRVLRRVFSYLASAPEIGFVIRGARDEACFGHAGKGGLVKGGTLIIESITDSDWAGCRKDRRSRSSIQLYVSGTLVGTMVRTQRSISLSSGEAEFGQRHMRGHEFIGDCTTVKMRSRSDRAACRGVCNRLGCRRIRNLHAGLLWVQAIVQSKELEVGIIPRVDNPSDLGTKPLGAEHEYRNSFS